MYSLNMFSVPPGLLLQRIFMDTLQNNDGKYSDMNQTRMYALELVPLCRCKGSERGWSYNLWLYLHTGVRKCSRCKSRMSCFTHQSLMTGDVNYIENVKRKSGWVVRDTWAHRTWLLSRSGCIVGNIYLLGQEQKMTFLVVLHRFWSFLSEFHDEWAAHLHVPRARSHKTNPKTGCNKKLWW